MEVTASFNHVFVLSLFCFFCCCFSQLIVQTSTLDTPVFLRIPSPQSPVSSAQAPNHETFFPRPQQHRCCRAVQQRASAATNALPDGATGCDPQLNVADNVMFLPGVWRHFRWVGQVTFAHRVQKVRLRAEGESERWGLHENGKAAGVVAVAVVEVWDQHLGREAGAFVYQAFLQLHARSILPHLDRNTNGWFTPVFLSLSDYSCAWCTFTTEPPPTCTHTFFFSPFFFCSLAHLQTNCVIFHLKRPHPSIR